ncbi:MAG: NTP transferase domain-containing protein [Muribaculaceae bacterium]|nr:NTP transferase domain-containing protein [Muribaculaceae bacterium]
MKYVILAAGLGSRFAKNGEKKPKPLVEIEGQPMIGRLIDILMKHGGEQINIVANSRMGELVEYLEDLKAKGYPLVVRPIISDNSYYSLSQAAEGIEGRFIAMTVDTIFPDKEFAEYVRESEQLPEDAVLMGLTRFVDDESPLYARMGENGEVIDYRYGGEPFAEGTIVSAGLYALNDKAMETVAKREGYPESLSDFQRILAAETDIKVLPFEFSKAMDVDCLHDQKVAEEFLKEINGK